MDIGIIYENQNVYILHFDNLSSANNRQIFGTLKLSEHNIRRPNNRVSTERFIVWKPNSAENVKDVRPIQIDIDELKSIKRAKMSVGNCYSYMIFFMRDGTNHPMMVFPDGGTKNLMDKLENYLAITKSSKERFLFLTEPRREDAVYASFESLGMFTNTKEIQASKFSRPVSNSKHQLWSGLVTIGANITNHIVRSLPTDADTSYIRDLIHEDTFGLPFDTLRLNTREDQESGFEIVTQPVRINLPPPSHIQRRSPLTESEWQKHLTPDGIVTCVEQLMEKIFKGGIEISLRKTVWKYLLKYYKWDVSYVENMENARLKNDIYMTLVKQWQSVFPEQEERFLMFRERKSIIEKDVWRTDRTLEFYSDEDGNLKKVHNILMSYSMYNFDLGYVQGMNDLLAPILFVVNEEVDSFWCFSNLMDTLEKNFSHEQIGIKRQFRQLYALLQIFDSEFADYLDNKGCREMLFCFRWLLVNFKRELSYENIMLLWEVFWTDYRCRNFHLLFALAVLLQQRNQIMENRYGFNEILKHVNDLKLNEDLECLLGKAESLYFQLEQSWAQLPEEMKDLLDFRISAQTRSSRPSPANSVRSSNDPLNSQKNGFHSVDFVNNSSETSSTR